MPRSDATKLKARRRGSKFAFRNNYVPYPPLTTAERAGVVPERRAVRAGDLRFAPGYYPPDEYMELEYGYYGFTDEQMAQEAANARYPAQVMQRSDGSLWCYGMELMVRGAQRASPDSPVLCDIYPDPTDGTGFMPGENPRPPATGSPPTRPSTTPPAAPRAGIDPRSRTPGNEPDSTVLIRRLWLVGKDRPRLRPPFAVRTRRKPLESNQTDGQIRPSDSQPARRNRAMGTESKVWTHGCLMAAFSGIRFSDHLPGISVPRLGGPSRSSCSDDCAIDSGSVDEPARVAVMSSFPTAKGPGRSSRLH